MEIGKPSRPYYPPKWIQNKKAENIAVIIVPARHNEKISDTLFPTFVLDNENGWFVETSCVIKVSERLCVAVGDQILEKNIVFFPFFLLTSTRW